MATLISPTRSLITPATTGNKEGRTMKRSRLHTQFTVIALVVFLGLLPVRAGAAPGDIGDVCTADQWCDGGICRNGVCEVCGRPGDRCCPGNECYYGSEGYRCDNAGFCSNDSGVDEEYCGYAGRPQCSWAPGTCYTGIALGNNCVACGDYYQPCCPNTAYECDYGVCDTSTRICVPVQQSTSAPGGSGTTGSSTYGSEDHHHDSTDADETATCFVGAVF